MVGIVFSYRFVGRIADPFGGEYWLLVEILITALWSIGHSMNLTMYYELVTAEKKSMSLKIISLTNLQPKCSLNCNFSKQLNKSDVFLFQDVPEIFIISF